MVAMIVFAVSGWSGAGKTRLIRELIAAFRSRGLRVLAVKHAGHSPALEPPGKDSRVFLEAGAEAAAVIAGPQVMQVRRCVDDAAAAAHLRNQWAAYDVVLLEGRAFPDVPFIEVLTRNHTAIRAPEDRLVAVVSDGSGDFPRRRFRWSEVNRLSRFMEEYNGL